MVRIMKTPPKKSTVEQIFNLHICSMTSEEVIEKLLRLTRMCKTGVASLCPLFNYPVRMVVLILRLIYLSDRYIIIWL